MPFGLNPALPLGSIPADISKLGGTAIAEYNAGLTALSTGAVGFGATALNDIKAATGTVQTQLSGLATGLTGGDLAGTAAAVKTAVEGDIGALIACGSKYGTAATTAWASANKLFDNATAAAGTAIDKLSTLNGDQLAGLILDPLGTLARNAAGAALGKLNELAAPALAAIDTLAKSVKAAISFVNSLPGLVSGIQKGAAFSNTVNRQTVDAAMDRVIGSDLIKSPAYELPSATGLGIAADIAKAKAFLAQTQSTVGAVVGQAQAIAGQAQAIVGQATNAANNVVTAANNAKNLFG
jgi:hypothetical protein